MKQALLLSRIYGYNSQDYSYINFSNNNQDPSYNSYSYNNQDPSYNSYG